MADVIEAIKRLYSGEDFKTKHLIIFVIGALMSIVSTNIENNKSPDVFLLVVTFLVFIGISIYIGGYNLMFSHNVFRNKEDLLPQFDDEPFKIFTKAIPLYVVWFLYFLVYALAAVIPVLGWIFLIVTLPFFGFVFTAFSKNYESDGLYKISLPLIFVSKSFMDVLKTGIKYIGISIAVFIPIVILTFIVGLFSGLNMKFMSYFAGILGGYTGLVLSFVWQYCLVKIYEEKIDAELQTQTED